VRDVDGATALIVVAPKAARKHFGIVGLPIANSQYHLSAITLPRRSTASRRTSANDT